VTADLDHLAEYITPLILAAMALLAWKIGAPEVIWGGFLAAGLTMLKQNVKMPTQTPSTSQNSQGANP
jgi:hypothetical protein